MLLGYHCLLAFPNRSVQCRDSNWSCTCSTAWWYLSCKFECISVLHCLLTSHSKEPSSANWMAYTKQAIAWFITFFSFLISVCTAPPTLVNQTESLIRMFSGLEIVDKLTLREAHFSSRMWKAKIVTEVKQLWYPLFLGFQGVPVLIRKKKLGDDTYQKLVWTFFRLMGGEYIKWKYLDPFLFWIFP